MTSDQTVCVVCSASNWHPLSAPGRNSMTTAGRIWPQAAGKAQCRDCGNVQKVYTPRLADTTYYEDEYTYYDRVGAPTLDQVRYEALARWVSEAVSGATPTRILDVGCGQGATLSFLKPYFPNATLTGLEPSVQAVEIARSNGLDVRQGRLGQIPDLPTGFDLIYSNNVMQHTVDPVGFLLQQTTLLSADGRLVVTCPDGTEPSIELLMADQNFSFRPRHLAAVADKAGLAVVGRLPCPGGPLRNEQLVVLSPAGSVEATRLSDCNTIGGDRDAIGRERDSLDAYLNNWARLDDVLLCDAVAGARRIFNFGGGLWSYVLAAYCPKYWEQVTCCLVDRFVGKCIDKDVVPFDSVDVTADDVLVLGTNPYVQDTLMKRFANAGLRSVAFNALIPH